MPKKITGIYLIRHKESGCTYVGQALSIRSRWTEHRKLLSAGNHHSPRLQKLWDLGGEQAFDFLIIEEVPLGKTELEVQRWLIKNERDTYNKLSNSGLLLNSAFPAIVATKIAKKQYEKEKKQKDNEHNRKITYERNQLNQELKAVKNELSPISLKYMQYKQELDKALNELDKNTGFFATISGRANSINHEQCNQNIAFIQRKIEEIEPKVMSLRARAEELRILIKSLHRKYAGVSERRVRDYFAVRGIYISKPPTIE